MASGGINASLATMEPDDVKEHVLDTINSAKGLARPEVVRVMCERAPKVIEKLHKLGVPFEMTKSGKIAQRSFGGSGKSELVILETKQVQP
jgi:succinate dehydrogenase / fumarate reductase flavoprotein subunit